MTIRHPNKTVYNSGAVLVNQVLYPYPCIVHAIHVAHGTGGSAWLQVHNSATVPPEGAVPVVTHEIPSGSGDAEIESGNAFPFYFTEGVYICESDTIPTKTLHAGLDLFVTIVIEERTVE